MAFDNYERYGVRVKKTAADVDDPYSLNGGKSLPILKDILSEISILRQDILKLKEEIAALHRNGPRPSPDVCDSKLESGALELDVCDSETEAGTFAVESPEPVSSPELSEPAAPILESRVPIEVPEPPVESIEPIEESGEPINEQTASTGGFFDEMPDDTALILSDSEFSDILSIADLSPAELSAEQESLSETVSNDGQEQAETPDEETSAEWASTEAVSAEVLDITDTVEDPEDGMETDGSAEGQGEADSTTETVTGGTSAEAADITGTAEKLTEATPAEVLDMRSEESIDTLEETSDDEPVPEEEFFQEITLPKDMFLEPELPPLDTVQPETGSPPEEEPDALTEVTTDEALTAIEEISPEVASTEWTPTEATSPEVLGELPPLDEEIPEVTAELPPPDDEPVEAATLKQEIAPTLAEDIKSVLTYIDDLLINLPEEKIVEFAQSDKYGMYKKVFHELGLG